MLSVCYIYVLNPFRSVVESSDIVKYTLDYKYSKTSYCGPTKIGTQ